MLRILEYVWKVREKNKKWSAAGSNQGESRVLTGRQIRHKTREGVGIVSTPICIWLHIFRGQYTYLWELLYETDIIHPIWRDEKNESQRASPVKVSEIGNKKTKAFSTGATLWVYASSCYTFPLKLKCHHAIKENE